MALHQGDFPYSTTSSTFSSLIFAVISDMPSESMVPLALVTSTIFRLYLSFLVNLVIIWSATTTAEMALKRHSQRLSTYVQHILVTISSVRPTQLDSLSQSL